MNVETVHLILTFAEFNLLYAHYQIHPDPDALGIVTKLDTIYCNLAELAQKESSDEVSPK